MRLSSCKPSRGAAGVGGDTDETGLVESDRQGEGVSGRR